MHAIKKIQEHRFDDISKNRGHHDSPFYELGSEESQSSESTQMEAESGSGVPTAVFHGLGDACINPGDIQIDRMIAKGTNAKVHCIEVGVPSLGEVFNKFETIA